tara:strand:+ start:591 stop:767 length:177 start_codon:yes stop_codon:yes gene_type:complete
MIKIIVCFNCKNYIKDFKCMAFPNGIPEEILVGENDHSEPLPNQENNIIFEPINEQEQ